MKKGISKNIFQFSVLIIELKNKKQKRIFFKKILLNFKKRKSKFSNLFFHLKSKNKFQKIISFSNFGFEIGK